MQVNTLRKDGMGIAGTYANANHHAQACLPLIKALEAQAPVFGFKEWKQGHNVHVFITDDGRKFDIIPYADSTGYIGLQYRHRLSRSAALPICAITDLSQVGDMITVIKATARPMPTNKAGAAQLQVSQV